MLITLFDLVGTTSRWNNAKLSELRDRVTHTEKCSCKNETCECKS